MLLGNLKKEECDISLLREYYDMALGIVKHVIGEKVVNDLMEDKSVFLDICYEKTDWLARCTDYEYFNKIEISYIVMRMEFNYIIEVLIHEILHTFSDTSGHDGIWLYYADWISSETPYRIRFAGWDRDEEEEGNYEEWLRYLERINY